MESAAPLPPQKIVSKNTNLKSKIKLLVKDRKPLKS